MKLNKIILSVAAVAALSLSSISFSMDIFDAILSGKLENVEPLIKKGVDVNQTIDLSQKRNDPLAPAITKNMTPLCVSCFKVRGFYGKHNPKIVKFLLKNGAIKTINKKDADGLTPLSHCCMIGELDTVKLLLENGALIDSTSFAIVRHIKKSENILNYLNLAQDFDNALNKYNFIDELTKCDDYTEKYNFLMKRWFSNHKNQTLFSKKTESDMCKLENLKNINIYCKN